MITAPTDTVTFLFTNIEGPTQIWEKHGREYL
jgi:class 3 adenylate cyclase